MASKIVRVFQNLFMLNGSAAHSEQFGSKTAGSPLPTLDPASIQALAAFTNNGWLDAVFGANKQPFLEDMNGLFRLIFYQICSVFQDGIPVWDPATPYFTGSMVRKDGTFELYGSSIDNNINNPLPSQTNNGQWQYLNPQSIPSGAVMDLPVGGAPPPGWLLCDGTAYLRTIYPNLFTQLTTFWNLFNGNSDPGPTMFRVPDFRGLTLIGAGQGNGFTLRTIGQLVGEEAHLLTLGEMPSHAHSVSDPTHSHQEQYGIGGGGSNSIVGSATGVASTNFPSTNSTVASATGITLGNTGGGGTHNNMQPSAVVNKIIKT